jgi:hypothetical protein
VSAGKLSGKLSGAALNVKISADLYARAEALNRITTLIPLFRPIFEDWLETQLSSCAWSSDTPEKVIPPTKKLSSGGSGAASSVDPNQKLGPAGYGSAGFISGNESLSYRVDFENDPGATAPAQVVTITDPLHQNLNWSTLELTEIGFGDHLIAVPEDTQHFETTVPMSFEGQDFDVHVRTNVDYQDGEFSARFYCIDPESGLPPSVDIGFLPPEDGTGRGMGHVSYVVEPKPDLETGTTIRNVAEIQFDFGEIIATNQVDPHDPSQVTDPDKECLNTVDASAPTSEVNPLPDVTRESDFIVQWGGVDGEGSGIVAYDVFVSTDDGPYEPWLEDTAHTSETFSGEAGRTYRFYSTARDGVGFEEDETAEADAVTEVNMPPTGMSLDSSEIAEGQPPGTVVAHLSTTDPDSDTSFSYALVSGEGDQGNPLFDVENATLVTAAELDYEAASSHSIRIETADSAGNTYEERFDIMVLDVNDVPGIEVVSPVTGQKVEWGTGYEFSWADSDPDDDATLDFWWDLDRIAGNNDPASEGTAWGWIAAGISEDDAADSWDWIVDAPPERDYYLGGRIDDGEAAATDYTQNSIHVGWPLVGTHTYEGGVTVSVYDTEVSNGVLSPGSVAWSWGEFLWGTSELVVDPAWEGDRYINGFFLFDGPEETDGVGVVVEGNDALGSFVDNRSDSTVLGFLATEGTVYYVSAPGGMRGANLNGLSAPGGWTLPVDLDEDGMPGDQTALYTEGRVETLIGGGHIDADVIAEEGMGFAMTQGGNWSGDLISRNGAVGQLLVIDGDIDLRAGRRIWSAETVISVEAIDGDLLGDGVDETLEILVGDGSLWSLKATGGKIDGLAVDVATTGGQPWEGAIGAIVSSGSDEGIRRSRFEVDHQIYSLRVQGPWRQQPGGAWAPTGNIEDSIFRSGGLSSVSVGADVRDSIFDVEESLDWLEIGGALRRTDVDAGNLGAVSLGNLGGAGSTDYHLTDQTDDWWLGVGPEWEQVPGTHDYLDGESG